MKTSTLLLISVLFLAACKKESVVTPAGSATKANSSATTPVSPTPTAPKTTAPVSADTLANLSAIKLKLVQDSTNNDETMFLFKKAASSNYDPAIDAEYFAGYGQVSLASISADGTDLAINTLPYTPNKAIKLDISTKNAGTYLFKISFERTIPANVQIWLKDAYAKDSLNVRTGNYQFQVLKSDSNSYGKKRFQLVLRAVH